MKSDCSLPHDSKSLQSFELQTPEADTWRSWLSAAGQWLLNALVPATEPQISIRYNKNGEAVWSVYNPYNRTMSVFYSEQDVLVWIEKCYR